MDINKFKNMKPMKYVGGASAKRHVENFLDNPILFKDWYWSEKVDGEWCRVIVDMDGEVTFQGRGISKATGEYKDNTERILAEHIKDIKNTLPKGSVFIGELQFSNRENYKQVDVGSVLRSNPPRALALQEKDGGPGHLYFYIFDILAFDSEDMSDWTYAERQNKIDSIKDSLPYMFEVVEANKVDKNTPAALDKLLNEGQEGIMLMHKDGKYLPGSRSVRVSLKIKKELGELTLKVVGLVDPEFYYKGDEPDTWQYRDVEGNLLTKYCYYGWKQGIIVEYMGNQVRVTSGVNDELAEWLASEDAATAIKNGELFADVTAMDSSVNATTGKPSLRHPVLIKIRNDINEQL